MCSRGCLVSTPSRAMAMLIARIEWAFMKRIATRSISSDPTNASPVTVSFLVSNFTFLRSIKAILVRCAHRLLSKLARIFANLALRSRFIELARVLVRFDHVALTDLTHFRIFPRNLAPDFTHYFSERPEMSPQ